MLIKLRQRPTIIISVLGLLYAFINGCFLFKYLTRAEPSYVPYILSGYIVILITLPVLVLKTTYRDHIYKYAFWSIVSAFFIFSILLNIYVDGLDLNVDRWSAMDIAITSVLQGQYPYAALDHLGQTSSNLPALLILGLPFYLTGDVGYLQSFGFLVFIYLFCLVLKTYKQRCLALVLLILSTGYQYELYVKSDLMTNFILVALCIGWYYKTYKNTKLHLPFRMGAISAFLLLTRLPAVIPLTLLLFKPFKNSSYKDQIKFLVGALITSALLLYMVFYNVPNWEAFVSENPLNHQNSQLPFIVSVLFIILPFLVTKKVKDLKTLYLFSAALVGLPVVISFIINVINEGWYSVIHLSSYDISYFNIMLPFIILSLCLYIDYEYHKHSKALSKPYRD